MKINKAIITAAGFGSRFLPFTKTVPKEMLPLVDKPIIHHVVEECAAAGIEEVIIVASPAEVTKYEDYFLGRATHVRTLMIRQGKLDRWNKVEKVFSLPHITVIPQDERLAYGNGSPVLSAKDLVATDEAFVVIFGDDVVLTDKEAGSATKQLIEAYESNPSDVLVAVQSVAEDQVHKYGIIELADPEKMIVERIVEKPDPKDAPSNLAQFGRFVVTNRVFDYLTEDGVGKDGEIWLADAFDELTNVGTVKCVEIDGEWMTTGDPLNYTKAFVKYALADEKIGGDVKDMLVEITG